MAAVVLQNTNIISDTDIFLCSEVSKAVKKSCEERCAYFSIFYEKMRAEIASSPVPINISNEVIDYVIRFNARSACEILKNNLVCNQ